MRLSRGGVADGATSSDARQAWGPMFPNLSAINAPHIPRALLNEPAGLLEVIASRLMSWMLSFVPLTYRYVLFVQYYRPSMLDARTHRYRY
jgi:hypothetical protein